MPTPTYIPLANTTVAIASLSVVFASIPATYRDLVMVFTVPSTVSVLGDVLVRINSDSGTNYSFIESGGNGSTSYSYTNTTRTGAYIGYHNGGSIPFTSKVHIMDYSATDKHKTLLTQNNPSSAVNIIATRWANTSAINRLEVFGASAFLPAGTIISLYGIGS